MPPNDRLTTLWIVNQHPPLLRKIQSICDCIKELNRDYQMESIGLISCFFAFLSEMGYLQ